MITESSASCTPQFTEYCRLFCRLRLLVAARQDESAEGEELREEMDFLWQQLTSEELDRLDGFALDLSHIGIDRAPPGKVPDALEAEFRTLLAIKDFDGALKFLRDNENQLPARDVAALRGILWAELGQYASAAVFMSDAVRLSPGDVRIRALYFLFLLRSGQLEVARSEAIQMSTASEDPYLLLLSADVLFDSAEPKSSSEPDFRRVIQLVDRAVARLPGIPAAGWRSAIVSAAMFSKALSHEHLGERSEAIATATEADRVAAVSSAASIPSDPKASASSNGRFREELHKRRRMAHNEVVASASPSLSAA